MLRALGAQIEKTTNKEACRDLQGRRLRDVNDEKRLKDFVSKKAEREQEEKAKKEARLEKLRRLANGENKHEFNDPEYFKQREEISDRVHDAVEEAFKKAEEEDAKAEPKASTSGIKRKAPEATATSTKKAKNGLWIGDGITESDLEDSSSDEEESK